MDSANNKNEYHHEWCCGRSTFNIMLHIIESIVKPVFKMNESEYNGEPPMGYKITIESIPGQPVKFRVDGKEYKKPEQNRSDFSGNNEASDT